MRKRLLLTVSALFLMVATMMAVPAKPGAKKTVTLSDGSTVELTLKGDEHYSYYIDKAGNPFQLVNDKLVELTREQVSEQWTAMKQQRLAMAQTAQNRRAHRIGDPSTTTGKHRGLVILMQYPDVPFVTENPKETFTAFFNQEGYNRDGMAGSVKDYFKAQSYGQLEIEFDVVGPYTTKREMAYYGKSYTDANGNVHHDTYPATMVSEGVIAASAEVDFRNYDWDGDKEVDQVFVIYAGYAEAQGAQESTIWPHEWYLSGESVAQKYNGVIIDKYGCASELAGASGTTLDGIGTACHEFSHCLGLPDMYDTSAEGNNFGMGPWDVMDYGSYNDNSRTPAGYTAYERWFSGWMEPTEINTMTRINDMKPLATNKEAYVLYNDKNKNEYYLLENRQPVGFDKGLYGHGLFVVHVDYDQSAWQSNDVNAAPGHERMTIIPADGQKVYNAKSLAGDPYPGVTGNTSLTNITDPAATLFNNNVDGTKFMSKAIDNIKEDVNAMTVSFVACRPELAAPSPGEATEQAAENGFTISWPAVTGAVGYEIELTTIDKAATTPEEALVREFDFAKFESKTAGFTDISSKLGDYGLNNWTGSKLYTTPNKLRFGTSTTTGTLQTPWWYTPSSTNATLVMGVDVVKSGTSVNGSISVSNADVDEGGYIRDAINMDPVNFVVTGNQKLVLHLKDMRKVAFQFQIAPSSQMYLNYLGIYDGIWTAEQLGINNAAASPRRASVVTTYTTETNSYSFKDMAINKRYVYRVRTLGEEATYSKWSEEKTFEFSTTGIQAIGIQADADAPVRYYDLQGREVTADHHGLVIMKQGNVVKKVVR
ncbi:MAG: M6 family metalloprotease domain-containing protein [Prevotella sp.]|nr:M6 family metalloprotease domain-containing protein [Prevotella sp.]